MNHHNHRESRIENPTLAHFRHFSSLFTYLLTFRGNYNIFPDTLFFNKQSQFRESPNEHKYLLYKGLSNFYPAGGAKKQTQFKPNQTQFPKSPNECKLNFNKGLQKKR